MSDQKGNVIAVGVSKKPLNGRKSTVTYSVVGKTVVQHYGAAGMDTSHEPQIAQDAEGKYAYQPDDAEGVPATASTDPMWTIIVHSVERSAINHRYKGSEAGAKKFGQTIWKFERSLESFQLQSVLANAKTHTIDVHLTHNDTATGDAFFDRLLNHIEETNGKDMKATIRLVEDLKKETQTEAVKSIVEKAQKKAFHDFSDASPYPNPKDELARQLRAAGLHTFAERVEDGHYDD